MELSLYFDIIVVTETWINDKGNKFDYYNLKGYKHIKLLRELRNGGGVSVYVKSNISFRIKESIVTSNFEKVTLDFMINGIWHNLCAYYRPPASDIHRFMYDIEKELDTPNPSIILGDFNINVLDTSAVALNYVDLLKQYDAEIVNIDITRPSSGTLIDHMIFKSIERDYDVGTLEMNLSDHNAVIAFVSHDSKPALKIEVTKNIVDYQKMYDVFYVDMGKLNGYEDPNQQMIYTYSCIHKAYKSVKISKKFKLKSDNDLAPWINTNIIKLLKWKQNIEGKIRKLSRKNLPHNNLESRLRDVEGKISTATCESMEIFYEKKFSECNVKQSWELINELIGRKKGDNEFELVKNGSAVREKNEVASAFASHFKAISDNIRDTFTCTTNYNRHNTLKNVNETMFLEPVEKSEIRRLICNLDVSKSPGIDGVDAKMIKALGDKIEDVLYTVINSIFSTGIYPDMLKIASIRPILKSGSKIDIENYRPISVLPTLNKIVEKCLLSRLQKFLYRAGINDNYQFGFREGTGTDLALFELTHHINIALSQGRLAGVMFLDVQKAFDSLSHPTFLNKLECLGIRGLANNLIKSYFTNRLQYVKINDVFSECCDVDLGIGQGTNLGPFFFNINLDDFKNLQLKCEAFRYADDICVLFSFESGKFNEFESAIKHDYDLILKYHNDNGMQIHGGKSKIVIFKPRHLKSLSQCKELQMIDGSRVQIVNSHKYLGYTLDELMSHENQIESIKSKITPIINILSRLKWTLSSDLLKRIYFAHVHSHLTYVPFIFGNATDDRTAPIQTLQTRALRHVNKLSYDTPANEVFDKAKVLPLRAIQIQSTILIMYKIRYRLAKTNIKFSLNEANTRAAGSFRTESWKTNYLKFDLTRIGPRIFNKCPTCLTSARIDYFKRKLKSVILANRLLLLSLPRNSLVHLSLEFDFEELTAWRRSLDERYH
jgi:hypothetical protein